MNILSHHFVNTSTPPDHTHSGIIVLVNQQYEILHTDIPIPGRMLHVRLVQHATQHTYNLAVYYARQVKQLSKAKMVDIAAKFLQVHDVSHNNIIIGDFNFADKDIYKGCGMSHRDHMMTSTWEEFISAVAWLIPSTCIIPSGVSTLSFMAQAKVGAIGFMLMRKRFRTCPTTSIRLPLFL